MNRCAWTHGPSPEYCRNCFCYNCEDRMDHPQNQTYTTIFGNPELVYTKETSPKEGVWLSPKEIEVVRSLMKWYWKIYNAIDGISENELLFINKHLFKIESKIKEYDNSKNAEE